MFREERRGEKRKRKGKRRRKINTQTTRKLTHPIPNSEKKKKKKNKNTKLVRVVHDWDIAGRALSKFSTYFMCAWLISGVVPVLFMEAGLEMNA